MSRTSWHIKHAEEGCQYSRMWCIQRQILILTCFATAIYDVCLLVRIHVILQSIKCFSVLSFEFPFSHSNLKKIDFKFHTFHYRSIQPNFLLFHHLLIFLFQSVQMFVAQFCDLLEVEISCDGCGATLPGRRYRCLLCQDMDLCTTCYAGQ